MTSLPATLGGSQPAVLSTQVYGDRAYFRRSLASRIYGLVYFCDRYEKMQSLASTLMCEQRRSVEGARRTAMSAGGSEAVAVVLTEADIPGAHLDEPFERHTIPELRWWLLCRGVSAPT